MKNEVIYGEPAWDTEILVSTNEIDEYIEEIETRLTVYLNNEGCLTDITGKPQEAINEMCYVYNIDPKKPLDDFSSDYWSGILATLRWVTMGGEKHDSDVLG